MRQRLCCSSPKFAELICIFQLLHQGRSKRRVQETNTAQIASVLWAAAAPMRRAKPIVIIKSNLMTIHVQAIKRGVHGFCITLFEQRMNAPPIVIIIKGNLMTIHVQAIKRGVHGFCITPSTFFPRFNQYNFNTTLGPKSLALVSSIKQRCMLRMLDLAAAHRQPPVLTGHTCTCHSVLITPCCRALQPRPGQGSPADHPWNEVRPGRRTGARSLPPPALHARRSL